MTSVSSNSMRAESRGVPYFFVACLAVLGIAVQVWLLGEYTGDDANTLFPVARHSLLATIAYYIRPIEYFVVQAANAFDLPLWIVMSPLLAVAAACVQMRNAEIVVGSEFSTPVRCMLVAGSPLWFYTVSQVDTVSQSLCNLAFAGALHCLVLLLFDPSTTGDRARLIALNAFSIVLLYTKELSITASCVLPAIGLVLYVRMRRPSLGYMASAVAFAIAIAAWITLKLSFRSMLPEASGHYNLSPGLVDIARNSIATLAFGTTPLPTSLLSIKSLATAWTICGVVAAAALLLAFSRLDWRAANVRWLAFALLVSCVPMFYVHASELYASMLGTFFVALLVAKLRFPRGLALAYGLALLLCSYCNAYVYFHSHVLDAAGIQRALYSVYYGPNGLAFAKDKDSLSCPFSSTIAVAWEGDTLICRQAGGRDDIRFTPAHGKHAPPAER